MKEKKERQQYFQEALSDFMYDAASGGEIRHFVDLGYSVEQIMKQISFPTARSRVEKTVYRYLCESQMLRKDLLVEGFRCKRITRSKELTLVSLYQELDRYKGRNSETQSYFECPFGLMKDRGQREIANLSKREQDYLLGITWEHQVMYHILNSRMTEIGAKLAIRTELCCRFIFLQTGEILEICN